MNTYYWISEINIEDNEEDDWNKIEAYDLEYAASKAAWLEYGNYEDGEYVDSYVVIKDADNKEYKFNFIFNPDVNFSISQGTLNE